VVEFFVQNTRFLVTTTVLKRSRLRRTAQLHTTSLVIEFRKPVYYCLSLSPLWVTQWCTNTRGHSQFVKFSILTVVLAYWLPCKLLFKDKHTDPSPLPSLLLPLPPTSCTILLQYLPLVFPLPQSSNKHRVTRSVKKSVYFSQIPKETKSLKSVFNVLSNPNPTFFVFLNHTSLTPFSLSSNINQYILGVGSGVWKEYWLLFLVYILFNLFYNTTVNPTFTHKNSVVCFFQRKKFGLEAQGSFARIIHGE
jgi:hypothetical protein